ARAQLALAYLIGEEAAAAELAAADAWPAPQRADAAVLAEAVEARPDVQAAKARVEAAERLRGLAPAPRPPAATLRAPGRRLPRHQPGQLGRVRHLGAALHRLRLLGRHPQGGSRPLRRARPARARARRRHGRAASRRERPQLGRRADGALRLDAPRGGG